MLIFSDANKKTSARTHIYIQTYPELTQSERDRESERGALDSMILTGVCDSDAYAIMVI